MWWTSRTGTRRTLPVQLPPLPVEERVDELALPLALDPLVLDEKRLAPHTELLEHPRGAEIAGLGPADQAVPAHRLERNRQDRPRDFCRIAAALVRGRHDEADLPAAVLLADPVQREVAGDVAALAKGDRAA